MENHNQLSLNEIQYIGFWKRVLMYILDLIIIGIPSILLYRFSLNTSIKIGSVFPFIIYWLLFCAFYVFMAVKFGGTPGKLLSKARIVDKEGNFLHIGSAAIRYLLFFLYSIIVVLKLKEGIDLKVNSHDISHFLSTHKGKFSLIGNFIGVITFFECLSVLFNYKKRTLHDFAAGSYVVSLDTYKRMKDTHEPQIDLSREDNTNTSSSVFKSLGKAVMWTIIGLVIFLVFVGVIHFISTQND
ncbi:putative RDD family membrane protein YckC [Paenibacillus sp. V4I3]|uniref:RDD family protein n=1 Tax=Paenibacillus sp. V4I3 TaxID=3042305 RepID=UPI002787C113|nr:RDD family protein [Paenibacillus sp. V4I3]MDQ0876494.1 putative RDD family membrane protein YckC [Paenibacillus sp. V4I3]